MCNVDVFAVCGIEMTETRITNVDVENTVDPKNENTVIKPEELLNEDGDYSVIPKETKSLKIVFKEERNLISIVVKPSSTGDGNIEGIDRVEIKNKSYQASPDVS